MPAGTSCDVVYGIRREGGRNGARFVARRYERRGRGPYIYQMCYRTWETLEVALMTYAVEGARCFPQKDIPPYEISAEDVETLLKSSFDDLLG